MVSESAAAHTHALIPQVQLKQGYPAKHSPARPCPCQKIGQGVDKLENFKGSSTSESRVEEPVTSRLCGVISGSVAVLDPHDHCIRICLYRRQARPNALKRVKHQRLRRHAAITCVTDTQETARTPGGVSRNQANAAAVSAIPYMSSKIQTVPAGICLPSPSDPGAGPV
jgi:hypothetical protein